MFSEILWPLFILIRVTGSVILPRYLLVFLAVYLTMTVCCFPYFLDVSTFLPPAGKYIKKDIKERALKKLS